MSRFLPKTSFLNNIRMPIGLDLLVLHPGGVAVLQQTIALKMEISMCPSCSITVLLVGVNPTS